MTLKITFSAADNTLLNAYTGEGGATFTAASYAGSGAELTIVGNKVKAGAGGDKIYVTNIAQANADEVASIRWTTSALGAGVGVGVRCANNKGYYALAYGTTFRIRYVLGSGSGNWLDLATTPLPTLTAGADYFVVISPLTNQADPSISSIRAGLMDASNGKWWDAYSGTWVFGTTYCISANDSNIPGAGNIALWMNSGSSVDALDDLLIGALPSVGATAITLSGPTSGSVGAASADFTVGADGPITGTVVVTPSDASGGGTFAPTTVSLTTGSPTGTFAYTPASAGAKTISVANNGSLTNPSSITYTAAAASPPPPAPPPSSARRRVLLALLASGAAGGSFAAAPGPAPVVQPPAPAPGLPTAETWPGLPMLLDGGTWERYDVATPGIMSAAPYGGTKHTRVARRTLTGDFYILGGDYGGAPGGSGSNFLWKVTSGKPHVFTKMLPGSGASGSEGLVYPARIDESPWMYDSTRDRFLTMTDNRWAFQGPTTPDGQFSSMMFYNPSTDRWTVAATATDPNGVAYPYGDCKWGLYDAVTDRYYILRGSSKMVVLHPVTLAITEYDFGGSPYTYLSQKWGTTCPIFDLVRRRIVCPQWAQNNQLDHPSNGRLLAWDMDTHQPSLIPTENPLWDPLNPLYLDFEASWHAYDPANGIDHYVVYGGNRLTGLSGGTPTNDLRVIPATGGLWKRYLPATSTVPPARYGQTMFWDPALKNGAGQLAMYGGIDDGATSNAPEEFFLTLNPASTTRPSWMPQALRWGQVPFPQTLGQLDPSINPAINPNYPGEAPWRRYSVGHGSIITTFNAWNSITWDDDALRGYSIAADGHNDAWSNARWVFDLSSNNPQIILRGWPTGSIGHEVPESNWTTAQADTGFLLDGRIPSMHTYNAQAHVPGRGVIVSRLTATSPQGHDVRIMVQVNPHTDVQTTLLDYRTAYGTSSQSFCQGVAHDPTRNCLWMVANGTCCIQKYDLATGVLTPVGDMQYGSVLTDNHALGIIWLKYLAEIDALLCVDGGYGVQIIKCASFERINVTPNITGAWSAGFGAYSALNNQVQGQLATGWSIVGTAWDTRRHRLMLWHNSANRELIQTLTPTGSTYSSYTTQPWTIGQITPAAGSTIIPSNPTQPGTYERLWYSRRLDAVLLWNSVHELPYVLPLS